jgi:transcriptional regulator with XRE-family HTH domain
VKGGEKMLTSQILKIIRVNRGISQKELARKLGFNQSYIAQLESGKKPITPKLNRKIKEALAISEENLIEIFSIVFYAK